jgi:hypothetical protein
MQTRTKQKEQWVEFRDRTIILVKLLRFGIAELGNWFVCQPSVLVVGGRKFGENWV